MPTGSMIDALAVIIGGFLGAFFKDKIPERLSTALPLTFGAASMGMGIDLITDMDALPPVILSLLIGSALGELMNLEKGIEWCASKVRGPVERLFSGGNTELSQEAFMEKFVGIVVLFCASGTGIFGALNEGMTGNTSILISKSFLDLFTAAIFATALGYMVITVAVPQFVILVGLFMSAGVILPLTEPHMIADFSGVGGIIMLVTGFRISGIKSFPIGNMLPALVLAMPVSELWKMFMG
ncbi:DUF554 domain-containing protein [Tuberibacillus sp. Marseille-P3662]|uniref:DUF554 domain-containing protein n=1 Tax=Tuberibacillus sp. Marseille-P3662 TaxID=1965358 RepID=UPI000A1CD1AB|nr:DUF554 domain-containing protein [Tuberibacillus sp. Marseille-P3662]